MSKIYSTHHRALQDAYQTRKLADTVESLIVHAEISDEEKAFIESREMFFLSTIDHAGRPSVSYKGGARGFVKVVDTGTLAFPSYDGNGMFLSMGNIKGNHKVGLLFIDFENPHRLRAYGEASVMQEDPLLQEYKEAQLIVRVKVTEMWKNCPRYIHKYKKVEDSRHVPASHCETPIPNWKKLADIQPLLSSAEQKKVADQGGTISMEELQQMEQRDDKPQK